jgi:hypothetical protein
MKLHAESHVDHGLTADQVAHLLARFADRQAFFIETLELPPELGTAPCDLIGPITGEDPVAESEVTYAVRGTRAWKSRLVDVAYPRRSRKVTVIAGPHAETCMESPGAVLRLKHCNGTGKIECAGMHAGAAWHEEPCPACDGTGTISHACILFTAYGGPLAPKEPGDIRRQLEAVEAERRARWRDHQIDPGGAAGGDEATRAAADPLYAKIVELRHQRAESDAFWVVHALAQPR